HYGRSRQGVWLARRGPSQAPSRLAKTAGGLVPPAVREGEQQMTTLDIVVGGNFGSEAKGHMVQRLTERRLEENPETYVEVVRGAGPNAGNTGHDETGKDGAFRQWTETAGGHGKCGGGRAR